MTSPPVISRRLLSTFLHGHLVNIPMMLGTKIQGWVRICHKIQNTVQSVNVYCLLFVCVVVCLIAWLFVFCIFYPWLLNRPWREIFLIMWTKIILGDISLVEFIRVDASDNDDRKQLIQMQKYSTICNVPKHTNTGQFPIEGKTITLVQTHSGAPSI